MCNAPVTITDNVQAEPAVTARLDNIEKMIEKLSQGFNEIKTSKGTQWPPLLQVNGASAQISQGQQGHGQPSQGQIGQRQAEIGGGQQQLDSGARGPGNFRARTPSVKRSADVAELGEIQAEQGQGGQGDMPWSQVVGKNQGRKPRKV